MIIIIFFLCYTNNSLFNCSQSRQYIFSESIMTGSNNQLPEYPYRNISFQLVSACTYQPERFVPGTPFPTVRISESHSVYRMAHRTDQSENSLPYSGGWALCVKD